ncbi:hypothetical protein BH11PAT4_BH11PAT4_6810 [soil metagenome]
MPHLAISQATAENPCWFLIHQRGRPHCFLDFDFHLKSNDEALASIVRLVEGYVLTPNALVTVCQIELKHLRDRRDMVSQDEPWIPLSEMRNTTLKVFGKQLVIPGFELGVLFLPGEDSDKFISIAAIPTGWFDDPDDDVNWTFPDLPPFTPFSINPPQPDPELNLSAFMRERELVGV